jgi:antitoxin component YwqK of YwqJK toxin-antitoxin module
MNRAIVIIAPLLLLSFASGKSELITDYYSNGSLKSKIEYRIGTHSGNKEGIKEGLEQVFFRSGKLSHEISYVNGKKDGTFKQYDRQGNLREVMHYKKRRTPWTRYRVSPRWQDPF